MVLIIKTLFQKIESLIVYSLRRFSNKCSVVMLKLGSKSIQLGANTVVKSYKSIRTIDGGNITIGQNCCIDNGAEIYAKKGKIIIGDNVYIGKGTYIVSQDSIKIGNDCQIAAYCIIRDSNHGINKSQLIRSQKDTIQKLFIGNDVWIGSHVSITPGTKLNDGVVIGTHSVVNKEIEEYGIAVGIPAKLIKYRQ